MKKLIVLLLALMLLAGTALAEDRLYISEAPQDTFLAAKVLTPESYPEIRLTPLHSQILSGKNDAVFLCFPGPDGAVPREVKTDAAAWWDLGNVIQYQYYIYKSNSFEEFVNKAAKEEYVLLDGSDGKAAYIDPEDNYYPTAYGMIATTEFDKSSKLVFQIILIRDRDADTDESLAAKLTDMMNSELDRISAAMTYETLNPYWSADRYTGVRFFSDYKGEGPMCAVDFPKSSFEGTEYSFLPSQFGGTSSQLKGSYIYGDGKYAEVTVSLDDYAYPVRKLEDGDENTAEYSLSSGKTWTIFCNKSGDEIIGWYASIAPEELPSKNDKPLYLTVQYNTSYQIHWTSVEELLPILETWDAGIQVIPE